jgi:hypothetical protein
MKWIPVATNTAVHAFELWNDTAKLAGVSFSTAQRSLRLATQASKRFFFYEKRGWLKPTAVIKNEYGVTIGKLHKPANNKAKGLVEVDGKKYLYAINAVDNSQCDLFDTVTNKNIASCNFKNILNAGLQKTSTSMKSHFPQLLLLLCWYSVHSGNTQNAVMQLVK